MKVNTYLRRITPAAALAIIAVALPATTGQAHVADAGPARKKQVALTNLTGRQLPSKSHINGTASVASEDGQFVVFSTDAALVRRDTNGLDDVYLRAVDERVTVLVSSKDGVPGTSPSPPGRQISPRTPTDPPSTSSSRTCTRASSTASR